MALGVLLCYRACWCLPPCTPGANSALVLPIREVQLGAGLLAGAPIKPSGLLAQGIGLNQHHRSPNQAVLLFTPWVQMQSLELAWKNCSSCAFSSHAKYFFSPTDNLFVAKTTVQVT